MSHGPGHRPTPTAPPAFTERTWEQLWERTLGQPDRVRFSRAVLRRTVPDDPLARRVVPELARRWRARCRTLALVWGAFVLFWASVALADVQRVEEGIATTELTAEASFLPPWCIGGGTVVVLGCLVLRFWLRGVARADQPGR